MLQITKTSELLNGWKVIKMIACIKCDMAVSKLVLKRKNIIIRPLAFKENSSLTFPVCISCDNLIGSFQLNPLNSQQVVDKVTNKLKSQILNQLTAFC